MHITLKEVAVDMKLKEFK